MTADDATFVKKTTPGANTGALGGQRVESMQGAPNERLVLTSTLMTGGTSYPSGGYTASAANLGLTTLREIVGVRVVAPADGTIQAQFVESTGKIALSVQDGTSKLFVAFSGNASAITIRVLALGVL